MQLSHGLPPLVTAGNQILRADTGGVVRLRGMNRSGLEYSEPGSRGFLEAAGLTREEVAEIVLNWNANVIRLPFNQDWALNGRGTYSAEDYRAALDQVIDWAAGFGAYTILDLQWLDADTVYGHASGKANHVAPTPDSATPKVWAELAARYRDEPAVIFDLFNEPHDPLKDDPYPIHVVAADGGITPSRRRRVRPEEWVPWAALLVKEIRGIRPSAVIMAAGVDWAFDLRGIEIDAPNIVYSAHVYRNRRRKSWWKALGRAANVPVFIGEWGGGPDDLDFGRDLLHAMGNSVCGWTAWSWADHPHLVEIPRAPLYRPTAFGAFVRDALRVG